MSKKTETNIQKLDMAARAADGYMYGISAKDREARSNRSARYIPEDEEILVKQSFKDEVDINNILDKYSRTGVLPETRSAIGQYLDLTNLPDYQTALNTVIQADEMFDELPAQVRDRFKNDPINLIEFMKNDENYEEAVALGLLDASAVERRRSIKTPEAKPQGSPAAGDGVPKT